MKYSNTMTTDLLEGKKRKVGNVLQYCFESKGDALV